jgi:hypothetical protein
MIRAAYLLGASPIVPILLKLAEEGVEEEADKAKGGGPPPGWNDFLKEKYEGGKKKVTNPNPDSKKKHPNVSISTALKTKSVWNEVYKEYKEWMKDRKEDEKPKGGDKKEKEPEAEDKKPEVKKEPVVTSKDQDLVRPKNKMVDFVDTNDDDELAVFANDFSARDKWEDHEIKAIKVYTGGSYADINAYLRGASEDSDLLSDTENAPSKIEAMDKVFNMPSSRTKKDLAVGRGIGRDHPLYQALIGGTLEVGTTFEDKGYASTSAKGDLPWGVAKMHIAVPKGTSAVYVGPPPQGRKYSEYPNEHEVLLNKGTKFRVTGWHKKKDYTHEIYLEVVND